MPHVCPLCNKRPAVLHITDMPHPDEGGTPTFLDICEICARERGILPNLEISLKDILQTAVAKALSQDEDEDAPEIAATTDLDEVGPKCPNCGITLQEIRQRGRFGCPMDYDFFRPDLTPLLQKIQQGTRHLGKAPPKYQERRAHEQQLANLNEQLEASVLIEDYEGAAKVRDEIKSIESTRVKPVGERPGPYRFRGE